MTCISTAPVEDESSDDIGDIATAELEERDDDMATLLAFVEGMSLSIERPVK